MGLSKAFICLYAESSVAIHGEDMVTIRFHDLSCKSDEDTEREVLAVAVSKYELAEIEGLVCIL